jgi:hypothetical protein
MHILCLVYVQGRGSHRLDNALNLQSGRLIALMQINGHRCCSHTLHFGDELLRKGGSPEELPTSDPQLCELPCYLPPSLSLRITSEFHQLRRVQIFCIPLHDPRSTISSPPRRPVRFPRISTMARILANFTSAIDGVSQYSGSRTTTQQAIPILLSTNGFGPALLHIAAGTVTFGPRGSCVASTSTVCGGIT